jgi:hypothetical protein
MELARTESSITVSGMAPKDEGKVVSWLTAMFESLNTYGRKWSPAVAQGWLMALRTSDLTMDEFHEAASYWLAFENDFPAPAALFGWVRSRRVNAELKAELARVSALLREQDDEALRSRNMERYGTEDPTREQVDARLAELGLTARFEELG